MTRRGEGAVLWSSESGGRGLLVAGTAPPDVVELWDWTLGPGTRPARSSLVVFQPGPGTGSRSEAVHA